MTVGHLIKQARQEKGWSQDDLAHAVRQARPKLRVTGVYISRYERGEQSPRLDILEGIAAATEKTLDAFKSSDGSAKTDEDEEVTLLRAAYELDRGGHFALADDLRGRARQAVMRAKRSEAAPC